ncbi:MAG TPA: TetR/AcrR family transcriptional regulator [Thermoleophilaceae bacterium]|jgi:AcrR family transcriptional regulator
MEATAARDGRSVRAERTRDAVVDALLELLDEGDVRPTAERIAERAGVSERSVFQHFGDREALFEAAAQRQYERIVPTLRPVDPALPLAERIDEFTAQRARLYEKVSGVRRGAILIEHESATVADRLQRVRRAKVREVEKVFAAELAGRDQAVRDALTAACAWTSWQSLRFHQGLSAARAREAMRAAIRGLLG